MAVGDGYRVGGAAWGSLARGQQASDNVVSEALRLISCRLFGSGNWVTLASVLGEGETWQLGGTEPAQGERGSYRALQG